jgi:PKHD-type hydroxylase
MLMRIPAVLTIDEVKRMRAQLAAASFVDGRKTASGAAAEAKHNLQLAADHPARKELDPMVGAAIGRNATFQEVAFPKAVMPPTYNRYDVGMEYGLHVDAPFVHGGRMRADLSFTLCLTPLAEYEGGELVMIDGNTETRIRLDAGELVLYPTTVLHRVSPVTRGSRWAAISWVQSYVPDAHHRKILFELTQVKAHFDAKAPNDPASLQLRNALFNLIRMWWQA